LSIADEVNRIKFEEAEFHQLKREEIDGEIARIGARWAEAWELGDSASMKELEAKESELQRKRGKI
jgi:hypothetical protein